LAKAKLYWLEHQRFWSPGPLGPLNIKGKNPRSGLTDRGYPHRQHE